MMIDEPVRADLDAQRIATPRIGRGILTQRGSRLDMSPIANGRDQGT